jgi:2,4-dienoyl-CoA reductase-like NADH-dependent reductase (Old Yellow Enzyme family)
MSHKYIFQPLRIGVEECPNRLGLAPMNTGFIDSAGQPSHRFTEFHKLYSASGLGLVCIGGVAVSQRARPSTRSLVLDSAETAKTLASTISLIRESGCIPLLQLMHAGRQANPAETGSEIVAPSPIPCPVVGVRPTELSRHQIEEIIETFVAAAGYARSAGVRLVELHAAHGYLLAEFLSRYSNKRTDEYGGEFRNRFRVLARLIEAVRTIDGIDVGVRISADEFVPGGLTSGDIPELIRAIQESGAVYVSVSAGVYDRDDHIMPDRKLGDAIYAPLGRSAKSVARVPIFLSGNVGSLTTAERLLAEGCADVLLLGRAMLADPQLIRKSQNSNAHTVQPCTMCRICKYHSRGLPHIACPHNDFLWEFLRETILETDADADSTYVRRMRRRWKDETS